MSAKPEYHSALPIITFVRQISCLQALLSGTTQCLNKGISDAKGRSLDSQTEDRICIHLQLLEQLAKAVKSKLLIKYANAVLASQTVAEKRLTDLDTAAKADWQSAFHQAVQVLEVGSSSQAGGSSGSILKMHHQISVSWTWGRHRKLALTILKQYYPL